MVRRDPDSGKFISEDSGTEGGKPDFHDTVGISGQALYRIPAADLSGGTTIATVSGSASELVDFSEVLNANEVFEVKEMQIVTVIFGATTSSGQNAMGTDFAVSRSNDELQTQGYGVDPGWVGASPQAEDGVVDIRSRSTKASPVLVTGRLFSERGEADDTNGVGRGNAPMKYKERIVFRDGYDTGPSFDADDELYLPAEIYTDAVSNFGVHVETNVIVRGVIHEI